MRQSGGMVIRRRWRAILYPLFLYCVSGAAGGYFVWHAVNGQRGLKTQEEYEHKIAALRDQLKGLDAELAQWKNRIELMKGAAVDRDLLDEETRSVLGRIDVKELVVFLPPSSK
ncbi:FtsB family cell division protein [Methylocapsa palsarum]|uniref:Cell division protein FtsB n=1 Tax=Methylocapsa palsarum TaxID=1612308 RepID=A0A1I3Y8N1_9HYPH|nr:septum formation initiator family protein [Methylocapsa palsarum]SFK28123.1 Cell division protein FtsB [Methylocapsa palsarum]